MLTYPHHPESGLVQQHYFALLGEAEIRNATWAYHLPDQRASGRPNIQSVSAAAVDIALQVTLDAIWNASACTCEQSLIGEKVGAAACDDIKSVTELE